MKCVLSHNAAYVWLMHHRNPRPDNERSSRAQLGGASVPGRAAVSKLQWFLDLENTPLEFLVCDASLRRKQSSAITHLCTKQLPEGSLIPIASGIDDIELYCVSPELCFIQLCQSDDLLEAIFHGMALCSDYRLDPVARSGAVFREHNDSQLTSTSKLAAYIAKGTEIHGSTRALQALAHVHDHSRSPKESGIAMFYGLPQRLGGMALGEVVMNPRIEIYDGRDAEGNTKTSVRYPDVLITAKTTRRGTKCVAFDYDSQSEHQEPWKVVKDSRRRNAIASIDQLVHYAIRLEDAKDFDYMVLLGDRARKVLGLRPWPVVRGGSDNVDRKLSIAKLEQRRFNLWNRFVRQSP